MKEGIITNREESTSWAEGPLREVNRSFGGHPLGFVRLSLARQGEGEQFDSLR